MKSVGRQAPGYHTRKARQLRLRMLVEDTVLKVVAASENLDCYTINIKKSCTCTSAARLVPSNTVT